MRHLTVVLLVLLLVPVASAEDEGGLLLKRIGARDEAPILLPRIAIEVFPYEGQPKEILATDEEIAVRYDHSTVVFRRSDRRPVRRITFLDPALSDEFAAVPAPWDPAGPVGPGVSHRWNAEGPQVVATAEFGGRTWQAIQPGDILNRARRADDTSWTGILRKVSSASRLEAALASGGEPRIYTPGDGLPGNIVTHLAVADGTLWAAAADIYDPEAGEWADGGLARYDPETDRFERVETIAGRPARFVTLLQAIGDDLIVGFREGAGVAGDRVSFGMGLYPGDYRPVVTSIVLARLRGGEWRTWARPPLPVFRQVNGRLMEAEDGVPERCSSEVPRAVAVAGGRLVILTTTTGHASGNWRIERDGHLWNLDPLASGEQFQWRHTDAEDLGANRILALHASGGDVVVRSDRGAHLLGPASERWLFLDPESPLRNPSLSAAVVAGDDLWFATNNQAFGVTGEQGVYRWEERAAQGTWFSPAAIGTACPVSHLAVDADGRVWARFSPRGWFGAALEFERFPWRGGPRTKGTGLFTGTEWTFPVPDEGFPPEPPLPEPNGGEEVPPGARHPGRLPPGLKGYAPDRTAKYMQLPEVGGGEFVLQGMSGGGEHYFVPTARAIWLLRKGEVIRMDRFWLEALLERDGPPPEAALLREGADLGRVRELLEMQEHTEPTLTELLGLIRADPDTLERAATALLATAETPEALLRTLTILKILTVQDRERRYTTPWWRWQMLKARAYLRYGEIAHDPAARKNVENMRDQWKTLGVLRGTPTNPFPARDR